jgi:hypothetical protein
MKEHRENMRITQPKKWLRQSNDVAFQAKRLSFRRCLKNFPGISVFFAICPWQTTKIPPIDSPYNIILLLNMQEICAIPKINV